MSRSVFGELQLTQITLNFRTSCCDLKIKDLGAKLCGLFYYFNFRINYDVLKSKNPCILLNKTINFNKNETESKLKIPHTVTERRTLQIKNCKLKVTLWWVGGRERKKSAFLVTFILCKGDCFYICALSQCIVCWIHFQNIHTFTYQIWGWWLRN